MLTLVFRDNIDGNEYVRLKSIATKLMETPDYEIMQFKQGPIYIVSYIGSDFYSIQTFSISSSTELGNIDHLLSDDRNSSVYCGPRVAESTQVLETKNLELALLESDIVSSSGKRTKRQKKTIPSSSELRERITPSWVSAIKGKDSE